MFCEGCLACCQFCGRLGADHVLSGVSHVLLGEVAISGSEKTNYEKKNYE